MDAVAALAPGSGLIAVACTALGLSRASLHRRQAFRRQPLAAVRPRPTPMRALVAKERQVVLDLLREPRFLIWLQPKSTPACSTRASICARPAPCIAFSPSMTKSANGVDNCGAPSIRSLNFSPKAQIRFGPGT